MIEERLRSKIRDIPDFPKPGIMFRDITPVLHDPVLCNEVAEELFEKARTLKLNAIAGVESRGFLFGMLLAQKLQLPFIPIRKSGKLPYHKISYVYNLEYGSAELELHRDAVKHGDRVLIHDDLLATGGTVMAASELINQLGGEVAGFSFLIELEFLKGKQNISKYTQNIISLIKY